ncbi:prostaglandin E synthase isoform 3-T5 [Theristicus caerulescens]
MRCATGGCSTTERTPTWSGAAGEYAAVLAFPLRGRAIPGSCWQRGSGKLKGSLMKAHRNDMENIFPFLFLGAIYSLLDPSPAVARIHFFIFCVGRIIHTIAYLLRLKAPTRSVAYSVAQLPCFSMALQILLATTPYW